MFCEVEKGEGNYRVRFFSPDGVKQINSVIGTVECVKVGVEFGCYKAGMF